MSSSSGGSFFGFRILLAVTLALCSLRASADHGCKADGKECTTSVSC
jgi:hypothetical protein